MLRKFQTILAFIAIFVVTFPLWAEPVRQIDGVALWDSTATAWQHWRSAKSVANDNDGAQVPVVHPYLWSTPNAQASRMSSANFDESSPDPDGTLAVGSYLSSNVSWVKKAAASVLALTNNALSSSEAVAIFYHGGSTGYDVVRGPQASVVGDVSTATASLQGPIWTAKHPEQYVHSFPGANILATVTLSKPGDRTITTGIHACIDNASAGAVSTNLNLKTTGGASIITWPFRVPTLSKDCVDVNGLSVSGISGNTQTLAFDAATGADTFQTVTIYGYSVQE